MSCALNPRLARVASLHMGVAADVGHSDAWGLSWLRY